MNPEYPKINFIGVKINAKQKNESLYAYIMGARTSKPKPVAVFWLVGLVGQRG